ncbi:MAG TPA: hypothetical protein VFR47_00100 [Anaerolineales bacterium]|nr:hypothetical protein [Anaerolineales bacterium]
MNRTKRQILSVILAITLLLLPSAVFAKELGLLTISGPGIKGEVTVDDASVLSKLEGSGFFDQSNMLKQAPENLGQGYSITSHLNLDGKMVPFIEMAYYPVEAGQPGYIHVTGRLDGTTLRKVDEWSKLPAEADKFFRIVMAAKEVTLQSAIVAAPVAVEGAAPQTKPAIEPAVVQQSQPEVQPAAVPETSSAPVQIPYSALALSAVVLAILGAALMLRRRAVSQRSA